MKIYVVMSTNENESEYYVKSAYTSENSADKAVATLYEEYAQDEVVEYEATEDAEEVTYNPWQVWIEELELQEDEPAIYTNYETKKVVEEILESGELYNDALHYKEDNGNFTGDSARELFEHHSYLYWDITFVDWQQVADELNNA